MTGECTCCSALLLLYHLHLGLTLGNLHCATDLLLPHVAGDVRHIKTLVLFVGVTLGLVDRETDVLVAVTALRLIGALTHLLVLHPAVGPGPVAYIVVLSQGDGQDTGDKYLC